MKITHRLIALVLACGFARAGGVAARADDLFPGDLTDFVPAAINPIFEAHGPGHWDARIRERGWILREADGWHLWYTGYDGTREGTKKLGYATSPDGLKWARASDGPIYDQHWVEDLMIVKHGDTYYMFAEGLNDEAQLLTSTDRVHWTRVGKLDVRLRDGTPISAGPYGTPVAWFENDVWHLFYERGDLGVWLATSRDMKVWTNVQDEPVMSPGPGNYDQDLIAFNQIVKRGEKYYVYYHGAPRLPSPSQWTTNIAVSDDLVHWQKYDGNPLLRENKSSGIVIDAGTAEQPELRLYTMHDKVQVHFPADHREATRQEADGRIVIAATDLPTVFEFTRPGMYQVSAVYASVEPFRFGLKVTGVGPATGGGTTAHTSLGATDSASRFITGPLHGLEVARAGRHLIEPYAPADTEVNRGLHALVLTPISRLLDKPIAQDGDGSILLHSRDVTIHGVKVQYEPKPEKNTIGFWTNASDWVSWDFTLTRPGTFDVEVLQGCGAGQGGSEVDVIVAGQTLHFTVEDTGHFQNFKPRTIGTVQLAAPGQYRLAVKPTSKAKNAVMDLRQVRLVPRLK